MKKKVMILGNAGMRMRGMIDAILSNIESQEKGTTVDTSIGDDTADRLSLQAEQAEGDKSPETVDGDPIGLNIEDGNLNFYCQIAQWRDRCECQCEVCEYRMQLKKL